MSTPQQAAQSPVPVGTPAGASYGMMSPPQAAGGMQAAPAQSMAAIGMDSTGVSLGCGVQPRKEVGWWLTSLSIPFVV